MRRRQRRAGPAEDEPDAESLEQPGAKPGPRAEDRQEQEADGDRRQHQRQMDDDRRRAILPGNRVRASSSATATAKGSAANTATEAMRKTSSSAWLSAGVRTAVMTAESIPSTTRCRQSRLPRLDRPARVPTLGSWDGGRQSRPLPRRCWPCPRRMPTRPPRSKPSPRSMSCAAIIGATSDERDLQPLHRCDRGFGLPHASTDACTAAPIRSTQAIRRASISAPTAPTSPTICASISPGSVGCRSVMSATSSMRGRGRDFRYGFNGNAVAQRTTVPSGSESGYEIWDQIRDNVSSATFRIHPTLEDPDAPDLYSPAIDAKSIRPGTVIYDPNGHVATVYRVEPDGRIRYMDAHPDSSITHGFYDLRFVRAYPGMGAGFKNWRPQQLIGAHQRPDGSFTGGHVEVPANGDIKDFSLEQFYGTGARPRERPRLEGRCLHAQRTHPRLVRLCPGEARRRTAAVRSAARSSGDGRFQLRRSALTASMRLRSRSVRD